MSNVKTLNDMLSTAAECEISYPGCMDAALACDYGVCDDCGCALARHCRDCARIVCPVCDDE
jgi:hypothetical protein